MKPKKVPTNRASAAARCERASNPRQLSKTLQGARREALDTNQRQSADGGRNVALTNYTCSGCNKPIRRDKFLLKACDKYWHENCLKCDRCHSRLGELGSTLYHKANMILCRQDYLELFGKTGVCSVCDKLICASEMVMRAKQNVYHLDCFACQLCNQRFCVGDRFYLCENKVVCQFDYEEHILPIQRSLIEQNSIDLRPFGGSYWSNQMQEATDEASARAGQSTMIDSTNLEEEQLEQYSEQQAASLAELARRPFRPRGDSISMDQHSNCSGQDRTDLGGDLEEKVMMEVGAEVKVVGDSARPSLEPNDPMTEIVLKESSSFNVDSTIPPQRVEEKV